MMVSLSSTLPFLLSIINVTMKSCLYIYIYIDTSTTLANDYLWLDHNALCNYRDSLLHMRCFCVQLIISVTIVFIQFHSTLSQYDNMLHFLRLFQLQESQGPHTLLKRRIHQTKTVRYVSDDRKNASLLISEY